MWRPDSLLTLEQIFLRRQPHKSGEKTHTRPVFNAQPRDTVRKPSPNCVMMFDKWYIEKPMSLGLVDLWNVGRHNDGTETGYQKQVWKKFLKISPFCGATAIPFWTSGDVSKPERIPCLHTSSPANNGFLRFTSRATPADLLMASSNAFLIVQKYSDHLIWIPYSHDQVILLLKSTCMWWKIMMAFTIMYQGHVVMDS